MTNAASYDKFVLRALDKAYAIIHFTPEGTITSANKNFLSAMGYSLDEIKGQHHRMFVDPAYASSAEYRDFWARLGRGEAFSTQFQRFGKGGKEIWIEASYNPVLDDKGRVIGIVKYAADITTRTLRDIDSQGKIDAIGRSNAMIEFTPEGTILDANANFLAAIGYSLDEIKGKHHRMFVDPAYAASNAYATFWQRLAGGEFFSDEFQRFGKGGKEIWIQATYNPIIDAKGRVIKVVKYASDITARKLATANYEGQLNAIGKVQAVIEFELDGTIITANPNFLSAMGYSLEEIKGKHHRIFVDPAESQTSDYDAFWRSLREGQFASRVFRRITKSGAEIFIQASYNPILDMSGRPFKVVKFATDVTRVIQTVQLADTANSGVQSVAAAIEEMSSSVQEISRNMSLTREATANILSSTLASSAASQQLLDNTKSMESVVALIKNIASQVNLLALNATIEAARAGEAGKGFAVVASEVKSLATQTTKATEDIALQIKSVQDASAGLAEGVSSITRSAQSVSEYVTGVASAIEEQTAVNHEISGNTQRMAASVSEIADRIRSLTK